MVVRLVILAAAYSGLSMCATVPEPEPEPAVPERASNEQVGPDGLILRTAPTATIESGDIPEPGTSSDAGG